MNKWDRSYNGPIACIYDSCEDRIITDPETCCGCGYAHVIDGKPYYCNFWHIRFGVAPIIAGYDKFQATWRKK